MTYSGEPILDIEESSTNIRQRNTANTTGSLHANLTDCAGFPDLFLLGFRNRAFSGESGRKKKATKARHIVGSPSTRNNNRQFAKAECPDVMP